MVKAKVKYKTDLVKISCIAIILTAAYFFVLSQLHLFSVAKLKTQDTIAQISCRLKPLPKNSQDIVIVMVDDESFRVLNKKWPWRRALFAYLVDRLALFQPRVIAIDYSLAGESDQKLDDDLLIQAMRYAGNVVIAAYVSSAGDYILPLKEIADSAFAYGFVNKPRDKDFYIRDAREVMFSKNGEIIDYSFSLKILAKYLGVSAKDITFQDKKLKVADIAIPIKEDGTLPINFSLQFKDFNRIPFWQVLNTELAPDIFKDKIVMVGSANEIVHDIYHTPLGIMPGVVINANELLMLLNRNFIRIPPRWLEFLIMLFFVLLATALTYKTTRPRVLFSVVGLIIIFWEAGILLFMRNIRLDYFGPAFMMASCYLGIIGYKYFGLAMENVNLKKLAITDGLTGLFVYRYFELRLNSELTHAKRYGLTFSLVIMDIDHFKKINDTFGHEIGNVVLRQLASLLRKESRKSDVVCRYGGEEFCVILINTPSEGALIYAEKMRRLIEELRFPEKEGLKVTASFGIASFPQVNSPTIKELITAADTALYNAKSSGRNQCVVFQPELL